MPTKHPGLYTIDVEDYFHIIGVSGTPEIASWDVLPSRVEYGLMQHFELLERYSAKATCFFLGYIAGRFPNLVKKAAELGHEVASHGMYHLEVYKQGRKRFLEDASASKKILEDILGIEVRGFRSAGFSIDRGCGWYFESLAKAGYQYDSSLLPNRRKHRIVQNMDTSPFMVNTQEGDVLEIPVSMADFGCLQVSMFGGGYLRFFPRQLILSQAEKVLMQRPLTIYIHPRELDPSHPQIKMNAFRHFKSYINMDSVLPKLEGLLKLTKYQTISEVFFPKKKPELI